MSPMVRSVLAVLGGILIGGGLVGGVQALGMVLFPLPDGVDGRDMASIRKAMESGTIPTGALVMVALAWTVGGLMGCWIAPWFAQRAFLLHAGIVAGLFLVFTIMNLVMIPHPLWMTIYGVLIYPVVAVVGAWLAQKASRGA